MPPKACVKRILPQIMIENIKELVRYYKDVPITQLTALYYMKYDEVLDACRMGFDTGLVGLIQHIPDVIKMSSGKNPILTLHEHDKGSPKVRKTFKNQGASRQYMLKFLESVRNRRLHGRLFDQDNTYLWSYGTDNLLTSTEQMIIVKSPYELLYRKNPEKTLALKNSIQRALSRFPDGIYVRHLSSIHNFDKVFFNVQSIGQLVSEYPELFYQKESNVLGEDDIVFDGATVTYCDVDDISIESIGINPWRLAFRCLQTGFYQKTLILIRSAGPLGLKLGVWFSSLERNFKEFDKMGHHGGKAGQTFKQILTMQPLHVALALSYLELIFVKTGPSCRNDLRLTLPSKLLDMKVFFEELNINLRAKSNH